MKNPKNIALTGASSGLGKALALHYAAAGTVLHLHGRNEARLAEVAASCREKGATVYTRAGDVTDAAATESWLNEADAKTPLDLMIANAGISAGTGGILSETIDQVSRIFKTNIDGVVHTVQPAIALMQKRSRGQIAIISSLAGFRGLPSAPAYSASKACVRVYGEGLRGHLAKQGIEVSVICPGYIKTPMTDMNAFPMPFILEADKAAAKIAHALSRNASRYAFPLALYIPLWFVTLLPTWLTDPLFAALPAKGAGN